MDELHIPEGINFECTGCGNCCLQWPVPVTAEDRERILQAAPGQESALFRRLNHQQSKLRAFTHTLEKRSDGKCEFLTETNRCSLHERFGPEYKPGMCQLFPYTFNPTPTGVYASVSFASTGALLNAGRSLGEQREFLQDRYQVFTRLLPAIEADWSNTQLVDGHKLSWPEFMRLDQEILKMVRASSPRRIDKRLQEVSRFLARQLPPTKDLEQVPKIEATARVVDLLLLNEFYRFYLPDDVFKNDRTDMEARSLFALLVRPPNVVQLESGSNSFRVQQLTEHPLGELDDEIEDLLYRFVYCRVFAKLYFGFGYCGLSVLVGIHHLCALMSMVRIQMKLRLLTTGNKIGFMDVVEIIRTLERRLTMASLSRESTAMLETLLLSPQRLERIIFLAS